MTQEIYKRKVSLPGIVAQLVTVGLLVVFWRLDQKWTVFPIGAFLLFLFFFLPKVVQKKERKFHKKALQLLATGKAQQVPELARRQILLSLFGPSAPIDAKIGMAYSQTGDHEEATTALAAAIPYAPAGERIPLQAAYLKALFVIGEHDKVIAEGKEMIRTGAASVAEVHLLVARAMLTLGRGGPATHDMLETAIKLNPAGDVKKIADLLQAELNMAHGKKVDTEHLLNMLKEPAQQQFVQIWNLCVLGIYYDRNNNQDEATKYYVEAVNVGEERRFFFVDMARNRLEKFKMTPSFTDATAATDKILKRKKKKR